MARRQYTLKMGLVEVQEVLSALKDREQVLSEPLEDEAAERGRLVRLTATTDVLNKCRAIIYGS